MRSQLEIMKKLDEIAKSGVDPTFLQRTTLTHKLTWENAKPYLKPEKYTEENKLTWPKRSKLEKNSIIAEMAEQVDYTYMLIANHDFGKVLASFQIIIIQIWLIHKENFLHTFIPEMFKGRADCGRYAMRKLCEEFGFNWKLYEARYLREAGGIILPKGVKAEDVLDEPKD